MLFAVLSSCGGGGGGGSSNPPPPPVELTPDQIYTGRRTPADISEGNHAAIAEGTWFGPMTVLLLAQGVLDVEIPDGPVDETFSGDGGGSVHIHGTISAGTGTLTADYSNYTEDGTSLQGTETMTILTRRTLQGGSVKRTFHSLVMRTDGLEVTLDGSLTRADSTTSAFLSSQWDISGDIVLTQSATSQKRVASVSLRRTLEQVGPFHAFPELSGTAQVFDSTLGVVDVAVTLPIVFSVQDPQSEAFAGSLRATGANTSRLWVSPLSVDRVAVEFGAPGTTKPTRSIVYRWDDAFENSAGATRIEPLAIATVRSDSLMEVRAGTPVPLESRFSEGANGEFVTPQWSLVLSPPGSQAQLVDANTTQPALLPDLEGGYLLRLEASDSTGSGSDYVGVYAFPSGPQPSFAPRVQRVLPPYTKVPVNSLVQLDGSRTYMTDGSVVQNPRWQVFRSTESTPLATGGLTVEFTAQADEDYFARFIDDGQVVGPVGSQDEVWVATTGNVSFSQVIGFDTQNAPGSSIPLLLADIDANGTVDLIQRTDFGTNAPAQMRVLLNKGAGRFDWHPVSFEGGATRGGGDPSAVPVDIDGDGRLDIVVSTSSGIGVFTQTQASPLSLVFRPLPRAVSCGAFVTDQPISFTVLDVDRDGRKDIVSEAACSAVLPLEFYRNDPTSPDGFAPAVELTVAGSPQLFRLAAGDVDGDGHADLLGVDSLFGTIRVIAWRNLPNSEFELLSATTVTASQVTSRTPVSVGDLDSDGKQDLVLLGNAGLEVAFGDGSGTFAFSAPLAGVELTHSFGEQLTLVDLDRDGRLDLTTPVGWVRQLPSRQFARGRRYPTSIGLASIADMDGDGRPDLVTPTGPGIAFATPQP